MGGYSSRYPMDLNDPYRPRPASMSLVFATKRGGHIQDLKQGIRRFLTRYYPADVAMRLTMALTFNYLFSADRRDRCILLTADGGMFAESVLLDLYARLSQQRNQLRTPLAVYEVSIEGVVDANRLQALSSHYFWTNSFFNRQTGGTEERYRLN